jgi:predicted enzyme related to lactoylglutathione lyase
MSILQGLTRTIVYVQDMETQVRFYRDVLDLKVQQPAGLDHYHDQRWVEFVTGECTFVLHIQKEVHPGKDRPRLAFTVSDVAIAHQQLTERGATLSEVTTRPDGFKVADGFDPEGNPFSIYS